MGSGHCAGMCGGIVVSLNSVAFVSDNKKTLIQRLLTQIVFNLGRIASYGIIGALAAASIGAVAVVSPFGPILRIAAAVMTIAIGLSIADWWRGISVVERLGQFIWRYIQPLTQRFMAANNLLQVLCLGLLWGWLPCGLVYTALTYAMVSGDAIQGFTIMMAFGLGTLPAMLLIGTVSQTWLQMFKSTWGRRIIGFSIILLGVFMLNSALNAKHKHHKASAENTVAAEELGAAHHH